MEIEKSRSQRRANTANVIRKQTAIAKAHGQEVPEPGVFRKHRAMDCGIPNCPSCGNPRRAASHEKTIQELRSENGFEKIEMTIVPAGLND